MNALLTPAELAARWRVTTRTLRVRRAEGNCCPSVMVGGHPRFRMEDIIAFEDRSTTGQAIPDNVLQDIQKAASVLNGITSWKMRDEARAAVVSALDGLRRHIVKK